MATSEDTSQRPLPSLDHLRIPLEDLQRGGFLIPRYIQDPEELRSLYPTIQTIAADPKRQDQPFASDEFPELEHFMEYAQSGYALRYDRGDGEEGAAAFAFLTPSLLHRITHPLYAEIRVCTLDPAPTVVLLRRLLEGLSRLAREFGYRACLLDTFRENSNLMQAARDLGFHNFLILPHSGRLANKGLVETLHFFKALQPADKPFPEPNSPDLQHLPTYRDRELKRHPSPTSLFPVSSALPDGTKLTLMKMEERHIPIIFQFFDQAVSSGQGFGASEVPDRELLEDLVKGDDPGHGFAAETADGRTVGLICISPHNLCRSQDPSLVDTYIIVDQSFKSRGLGTFICKLWVRLAYELGYKAVLSDTFITNAPALTIVRNCHFTLLGTIRRGGHLKDRGFTDTIMFYRETFKGDPQQAELSKI